MEPTITQLSYYKQVRKGDILQSYIDPQRGLILYASDIVEVSDEGFSYKLSDNSTEKIEWLDKIPGLLIFRGLKEGRLEALAGEQVLKDLELKV